MKRYFFLPWLSAFLLANGLWMLLSPMVIRTWVDKVESILMIAIGLFGLYQSLSAAWSIRKGGLLKDELTDKIRTKAAALAFRISIWCWIGLMIANMRLGKPQTDILELGILMMAGTYILSFAFIKVRGLRDE